MLFWTEIGWEILQETINLKKKKRKEKPLYQLATKECQP